MKTPLEELLASIEKVKTWVDKAPPSVEWVKTNYPIQMMLQAYDKYIEGQDEEN